MAQVHATTLEQKTTGTDGLEAEPSALKKGAPFLLDWLVV